MAKLYNLAKVNTATTGTGDITLGAAVSGFLNFTAAGVLNGDVVSYSIRDGANSESGVGTYSTTGPTLTRTVLSSTNSGAAIDLSGSAVVMITPNAQDFGGVGGSGIFAPPLAGWFGTAAKSGVTATLTDATGFGMSCISAGATGGDDMFGATRAVSGWSTSSYKVRARLTLAHMYGQFPSVGLYFYDSATGHIQGICSEAKDGPAVVHVQQRTLSAFVGNGRTWNTPQFPEWYELEWNSGASAQMIFRTSFDGVNFQTDSDFFGGINFMQAITHVGIFSNGLSNDGPPTRNQGFVCSYWSDPDHPA